MCPTEATLFGRRLQVRAESQQTAIDCEGQWGVARKRRTVALRLRSLRSLPAADKLGASRVNEWQENEKRIPHRRSPETGDRVRDDKLKKWTVRKRRRRVDDHSPFRATCSYVFRVSIERRSLKEEKNVPRPPGRVAVCGELTRICRDRAGRRGRLRVFVQRGAGQGSGAASASLR